MLIKLSCSCGQKIEVKGAQGGKHLQCPACGRALTIPEVTRKEEAPSNWQIDMFATAAEKAERAGITRKGQASVALLHSPADLEHDLHIEGVLTCWYCRKDMPFSGHVFGRTGLSGRLLAAICIKCRAKILVNFSTHEGRKGGSEVFIFAPSHTRDSAVSDDEPVRTPTFRVKTITENSAPGAGAGRDWVNELLPAFVQAVAKEASFQEVTAQASKLVTQPLNVGQLVGVCRPLTKLLEKVNRTYLKAILAEVLLCFRYEDAADTVQHALRGTFDRENLADPTNLPMHDLAILSLFFGSRDAFLEAVDRGMGELTGNTKAFKLRKRLTFNQLVPLVREGHSIDTFESKLGGSNWQQVQPVLPF